MFSAVELFRENIVRVRNLGGLTQALVSMTTSVVDSSDILRAQYVLAVSALDHYVHELTRLGMLEIFDGKRSPPPGYLRFQVSLAIYDAVGLATGNIVSRDYFDSEIRAQHGYVSFQQPDKVAEAIRLIKEVKLWDRVGYRLGMDAGDIKQRLKLIVDRRNKIAHEADLDPTYPKARWPISAPDVENVVGFLVEVVEAIHSEVA
jgi:RiboL-PSP-HEPN